MKLGIIIFLLVVGGLAFLGLFFLLMKTDKERIKALDKIKELEDLIREDLWKH